MHGCRVRVGAIEGSRRDGGAAGRGLGRVDAAEGLAMRMGVVEGRGGDGCRRHQRGIICGGRRRESTVLQARPRRRRRQRQWQRWRYEETRGGISRVKDGGDAGSLWDRKVLSAVQPIILDGTAL